MLFRYVLYFSEILSRIFRKQTTIELLNKYCGHTVCSRLIIILYAIIVLNETHSMYIVKCILYIEMHLIFFNLRFYIKK